MNHPTLNTSYLWDIIRRYKYRLIIFLSIFGPATITAMADNDASGVATYSIAGATLGYSALFILLFTVILLGITQEMGIRLSLVTRKGLGDLIREHFGVRASLFIFSALLIANMGTIVVNLAAVKTTSSMFGIPQIPSVFLVVIIAFLLVSKGSYKTTQNAMLITSLFYSTYIFSAIKVKPDWHTAITSIFFPTQAPHTAEYMKLYFIIALGAIGTTITPWGQFFISSFSFDKHIDMAKLKYSQMEAYFGAMLTHVFVFFIIVATAATLYANNIPLISGEQAAMAIKPFAGELAGTLFAIGILNAGFMGVVIVGLSTAYAFSEFFGYSGSLDESFTKSRGFYVLFLGQLLVAAFILLIPGVSLFRLAIASQALNAIMLPFIFYYLIRLTNNKEQMGKYRNSPLQQWTATIGTIIIATLSIAALIFAAMNL